MPLKFLITIITKIEISEDTRIKPGVFLSNEGRIIIGAKEIGSQCRIEKMLRLVLI